MSTDILTWDLSVDPSNSAILKVPLRQLLKTGALLYYSVLISELDCQSEPEIQRKIMDIRNDWPRVNSWHDVQNDACQRQYQATPERHSVGLVPLGETLTMRQEAEENLEIQIGTQNCPSIRTDRQFCNGPLRPGTKYAVVLRLFTESGFTDNSYLVLETVSEIKLSLIVLMVVSVLLSAFLVGVIIVLRKRNQTPTKDSLTEPANKKPSVDGDILTKNFPVHFEDLSKNNCERLNMEFNLVNACGPVQSSACTVAKMNTRKNRYTNILPCKF